ncbi:MAG: serine/threonine-protein kinase [Deltaproteobacteria bacterium]
MSAPGIETSSTDEERAFLKRRVELAALVSTALIGAFFLYRTIIIILVEAWPEITNLSYPLHGAASLNFLVVWAIARHTDLSMTGLRRLETTGVLTGSIALIAMGTFIPLIARPDMIVLVALTYALLARSVFVPSSGRRTLALSVAIGAAMLIGNYIAFSKIDAARWSAIDPQNFQEDGHTIALWLTITQGVWWLLTAAIATSASWVIYGLRRKVRDALQLGQYRLEAKLGEGGMGEVYRAHHAFLRRPTAVKLLRPERAGEKALKRFENEVQLTAKLAHPNTVTIFDYGHTSDGVFYYAMELLAGADIDRIVRVGGPQPQARVRHLLLQICGALIEAHGVGLIHRDIKPGNIMVSLPHRFGGANDHVTLLDFGLVKEIQTHGGVSLTQTNVISGTPQYMSPETIRSPDEVDARSDLYAVGAVAYFLLTGRPVFPGDSVVQVCSDHLHKTPDPISKHRDAPLSPTLEALLMQCLAKAPEDRPASAFELAKAIDGCADETGTWTPNDAAAWWAEHGARLEARVATGDVSVSMTVDVGRSR